MAESSMLVVYREGVHSWSGTTALIVPTCSYVPGLYAHMSIMRMQLLEDSFSEDSTSSAGTERREYGDVCRLQDSTQTS